MGATSISLLIGVTLATGSLIIMPDADLANEGARILFEYKLLGVILVVFIAFVIGLAWYILHTSREERKQYKEDREAWQAELKASRDELKETRELMDKHHGESIDAIRDMGKQFVDVIREINR